MNPSSLFIVGLPLLFMYLIYKYRKYYWTRRKVTKISGIFTPPKDPNQRFRVMVLVRDLKKAKESYKFEPSGIYGIDERTRGCLIVLWVNSEMLKLMNTDPNVLEIEPGTPVFPAQK